MSSILDKLILPRKLALNGIDEGVKVSDLYPLAKEYCSSFGILLTGDPKGRPRYPSLAFIKEFIAEIGRNNNGPDGEIETEEEYLRPYITLDLHLCGEYIDMMIEEEHIGLENYLNGVSTVQFNVAGRDWNREQLADFKKKARAWCVYYGFSHVMQVRGMPEDDDGTYLIDNSLGTGRLMTEFPVPSHLHRHGRGHQIGYAGGINHTNVVDVMGNITKEVNKHGVCFYSYYLDIESGVRNVGDQFSVEMALDLLKRTYDLDESQVARY